MSKLRIFIQLLFWALLPTLMGCSADDSLVLLPNIPEEEPMEIRLYATTLAQADAVVTRISNGSFEAEDELGVYSENLFKNTLFTLKETYFTSEEKTYFPLSKEELTLSAYYPYSETITDNMLPVKSSIGSVSDPTWANATTDPLWAETTIEKGVRNENDPSNAICIQMTLKHQMAWMKLYADEDVKINSIEITFKEKQYGYMNIATGEIISVQPDAPQSISWIMASIENGTNTSDGININGLFLPNEDAIASIKIYQNGEQKTIFPNDAINNIALQSGKVTTIRISKGNNASTRNNDEICLSIEE